MKPERQKMILDLFNNGDGHATLDGEMYFMGRKLIKQRLSAGYYWFCLNRRDKRTTVLSHNLMWLASFGTFGADKKVTFKNKDRGNFKVENLVLVDRKVKKKRALKKKENEH